MRTPKIHFGFNSALTAVLICVFGLGVLASPPRNESQFGSLPQAAALISVAHAVHAIPAAAQEAGQAAPPAAAAAPAPQPVVLPDGDGKPIATEFCQTCHKLTNLTKAHKSLDDWKDTIQTMIERGAAIPDDKVDTLAQYLAKNFGPKDEASGANAPATAAAPATPTAPPSGASSSTAPANSASATPPGAPAAASASSVVVLPDGDGKEIATENCQACHKLTNLTKAHKSLDDWKDTVQTMIDRGANVPADKVDILVQYLAKNFGPKDASAPAAGAPVSSAPTN